MPQLRLATFLAPADPSAAVPCTSNHVSRTVFIGRLWTDEAYSNLLNDPKIGLYVAKQCLVPTQQAIGPWKTVAVAGYEGASFFPTQAQYTAGAHWFRCDVVLPGAAHFYPVPNQNPEAVPLSPGHARCIHMTSQGGLPVACAASHTYRAAGVVWAPGAALPSRTSWIALARAHCPPLAHSANWLVTWPGALKWSVGDHYLTCYRPTTA